MIVDLDLTLFDSPTSAFGQASGDYCVPDTCGPGDYVKLFDHGRWEWFSGSLKVEYVARHAHAPEKPSFSLEYLVVPSLPDAKDFAKAVEKDLGLFFYYYNKIDSRPAVRELLFVHGESGQKKSIAIRLGQPYWIENNTQAACEVHVEGMLSEPLKIYGMDPLQVLDLAIKFIDRYLQDNFARRLFWPSGEPYEGQK